MEGTFYERKGELKNNIFKEKEEIVRRVGSLQREAMELKKQMKTKK